MDTGWVKLHRKLRDNPYMRRPAYRAVWIELLLEAQHGMKVVGKKRVKKEEAEMKTVLWRGKKMYLKSGQLTVGMKQLSEWTGVPRGTCERIVKCFKNEEMIEEQTSAVFSLITIKNWGQYQNDEEPVEELMRNKRGTDEELMRTPKEWKNGQNGGMEEPNQPSDVSVAALENLSQAPEPPPSKKERKLTDTQKLVHSFFLLKGWVYEPKLQVVFRRHLKSAANLLLVAESLEVAEERMGVVAAWADAKKLDWTMETVVKKWFEIDQLPLDVEAAKKSFIDGDRAYRKNGNWYVIVNGGEHKQYIGPLEGHLRYE